MKQFLTSPLLRTLAAAHPSIELTISPRPNRHPVIKATYVNGREKAICVRNMEKEQVLQKAELLGQQASGDKLSRRAGRKVVDSSVGGGKEGRSVRGIWSPYHQLPERSTVGKKEI
ncbi:MAG: 39S ribosomal protein L51, mitochondrial [Sclerophora amabilis]|nr:MAG: 39S ribosomal protein L51, mitochondrial [Sclerophora amabilis]